MITNAVERLTFLCHHIPSLLNAIDEVTFNEKASPNKWSKKEIIGHLIDSATNNHQRFVRAQFEDRPNIAYDQDSWNRYSFYQQIDRRQVIDFWEVYNKQLLELIKCMPRESLQRECLVGVQHLTLGFLINDYVEHLEHHLQQVVAY